MPIPYNKQFDHYIVYLARSTATFHLAVSNINNKEKINEYILNAKKNNTKPRDKYSLYIAEAAKLIAERCNGIDASIVELPCHTEGTIRIMLGEDDLIVGNALMNMVFLRVALIYGNYKDMQKSVELYSNLKAKKFILGAHEDEFYKSYIVFSKRCI